MQITEVNKDPLLDLQRQLSQEASRRFVQVENPPRNQRNIEIVDLCCFGSALNLAA